MTQTPRRQTGSVTEKAPPGRRGLCVTAVHLWGDGGLVDHCDGANAAPSNWFLHGVKRPRRVARRGQVQRTTAVQPNGRGGLRGDNAAGSVVVPGAVAQLIGVGLISR
jgi:hypothetical protein